MGMWSPVQRQFIKMEPTPKGLNKSCFSFLSSVLNLLPICFAGWAFVLILQWFLIISARDPLLKMTCCLGPGPLPRSDVLKVVLGSPNKENSFYLQPQEKYCQRPVEVLVPLGTKCLKSNSSQPLKGANTKALLINKDFSGIRPSKVIESPKGSESEKLCIIKPLTKLKGYSSVNTSLPLDFGFATQWGESKWNCIKMPAIRYAV